MAIREGFEIPRSVDKLTDIDQDVLRPFYAQGDDGRYHLRLRADEPDVERKLAEFRENNRALYTRLAEWTDLGLDVATLKARLAELDVLKAAAASAGDVEQQRATLEQQLQQEKASRAADTIRHEGQLIFLARGGNPDARELFATEVAKHFEVSPQGEIVPKAVAGPGLSTWVDQMAQGTLAFLFKPSKGGGATGSAGPPADSRPVINRDDVLGFGENAAGIAAGKIRVV